jgi:hypothetical protein
MKKFYKNRMTGRIRELADSTSQFIDGRIKAGYAGIAPYLLSPQWVAGYSGLKKLIEKDYNDEEETVLGSVVSS